MCEARPVARRIRTFLTFQRGAAEGALEHYRLIFDDFELLDLTRHGAEGGAAEGQIRHAVFRLGGHELACSDSPIEHAWDFTPAFSLWIDCEDEAEQDRLFTRLGEGGQVFMPLGDYGFSRRFGWVGDRHGVTWQLNLP